MGWKKALPYLGGYFGIWLACGLGYKSIADWSHGDDFVFAGDLKTNSMIAAFRDKTGSKVNDGIIKAIADAGDYQRSCTELLLDSTDSPRAPHGYYACSKTLGFLWSFYYYERLMARGYTSFVVTPLEHKAPPRELPGPGQYKVLHWYAGRNTERFWHDSASADSQSDMTDCCFVVELALHGSQNETMKLLLTKELKATKGRIDEQDESIRGVLINSLVFPDEDLSEWQTIADDSYYSLLDFLYFSAITITTVGFGDIVPNSQLVRLVVMLETLSGIVLISIFVARLLA